MDDKLPETVEGKRGYVNGLHLAVKTIQDHAQYVFLNHPEFQGVAEDLRDMALDLRLWASQVLTEAGVQELNVEDPTYVNRMTKEIAQWAPTPEETKRHQLALDELELVDPFEGNAGCDCCDCPDKVAQVDVTSPDCNCSKISGCFRCG